MVKHRALGWALVPVVALTTGCGTQRYEEADRAAPSTPSRQGSTHTEASPEGSFDEGGPPDVVIDHGDVELSLQPWTTCWSTGDNGYCADGMPPQPLPELGQVGSDVLISFPLEGWTFHASQQDPSDPCSEVIRSQLEPVDEGTWRLSPAGPASRYQVDVWGDGPEGDVIVSFAMTTTKDGPLPAPQAFADVFHPRDGQPVVYSEFEVDVAHLASAPEQASATLVVTASDGRDTTFRLRQRDRRCQPRNSVNLHAPAPGDDVVSAVGPPPYELHFSLELDKSRYVAVASWPQDYRRRDSTIRLDLKPALPAR